MWVISTLQGLIIVDLQQLNRPQKGSEKADFIGVTAWRATAEFISKYFQGSAIIVEGSLRNNDYTDKDGIKHYSMEVLASNVSVVVENQTLTMSQDKLNRTVMLLQTVNEPNKLAI